VGFDWSLIAAPATTTSASSIFVAVYARKTDAGPDPFDVEIDMVDVAPTGGAGLP
jgi:hypothetical protein